MKRTMIDVAIDPGKTTGVAWWLSTNRTVLPDGAGAWPDNPPDSLKALLCGFHHSIDIRVSMEEPAYFQSSGGITSARSGALVKLVLMAGRLQQVAHEYATYLTSVRVVDWKGQLPKHVVRDRIAKLLDRELEVLGAQGASVRAEARGRVLTWLRNEHAVDAIGIGLYTRGVRI